VLDKNGLQNDTFIEKVMPIEPVADKWRAFGWRVIEIDGHNMAQIVDTLELALTIKGVPTIVIAKTVKGKGVSFMENSPDWHGKAPNEEQYRQAMKELGGVAQ
jgi:transketolase